MGEIFGKGWGFASRDGVVVGFDPASDPVDMITLGLKGSDHDVKIWDFKPRDISKPITMSFTIQDINPEVLRLLYGADFFDNQEDHRMTKPTNKTPDGTILRLVDSYGMSAKAGALAVVDSSKRRRYSADSNLPVRWIKGANDSIDGTYMPCRFELTGFAVGDHVEVTGMPSENGWKGKILGEAAENGDDVRVQVRSNFKPTYRLEHLKKTEAPKVSDFNKGDTAEAVGAAQGLGFKVGDRGIVEGPSASKAFVRVKFGAGTHLAVPSELRLIKKASPAIEPKFKVGDLAVIAIRSGHRWNGTRVRITGTGIGYGSLLSAAILDKGTDINKYGDPARFHEGELRAFDPARDYREGDKVRVVRGSKDYHYLRHGSVATVAGALGASSRVSVTGVTNLAGQVAFQTVRFGDIELIDQSIAATKADPKPAPAPKPKPKFEVGDRVKVIDNRSNERTVAKGEVGTVKKIGEQASFTYPGSRLLTVMADDGRMYQLYDFRFERVAEPVRENFALTGAYVGDKAGLDALPVGTVIEGVGNFGVDVRIKLRKVGETAKWYRMGLGGPSQFPLPMPGSGEFLRRAWVVKHVPGEFPETKAA